MADRLDLNYKAIELRKKLGEDEYSPIDIFALTNNIKDLSIVLYPFNNNISGMCYKNKNANVISINSNSTTGRKRFTLAHELFHLYYGDNDRTISNIDFYSKVEEDANIFASYLLVPYGALRKDIESLNKELNDKNIINLTTKYGLSYKAMIYRLFTDNYINESKYNELNKNEKIIAKAKKYGFDTKVFDKENNIKVTYGNYIDQVNTLDELNMISLGKKRELLIKAFREDLIYNLEVKNIIDD